MCFNISLLREYAKVLDFFIRCGRIFEMIRLECRVFLTFTTLKVFGGWIPVLLSSNHGLYARLWKLLEFDSQYHHYKTLGQAFNYNETQVHLLNQDSKFCAS